MRLIVVSGLSGSGKSVALRMLEDLDYYCVDNIPPGLLPEFISHIVRSNEPQYKLTAIGIDARNSAADMQQVPLKIAELKRSGVDCEVIYLRAETESLIKRYSETRRRHPLSRGGLSLTEAIAEEQCLLEPMAASADLIIDTTRTSVHDLRELIRQRVGTHTDGHMSILFESFAFKQGIPSDADFLFDARSLPNPFWEPSLANLTGRDQPVIDYLIKHPEVQRMIHDLSQFLDHWIPEFIQSNRSYLTIAIGCTGGQHRSVFLVEQLVAHFRKQYPQALAKHRMLGLLNK